MSPKNKLLYDAYIQAESEYKDILDAQMKIVKHFSTFLDHDTMDKITKYVVFKCEAYKKAKDEWIPVVEKCPHKYEYVGHVHNHDVYRCSLCDNTYMD